MPTRKDSMAKNTYKALTVVSFILGVYGFRWVTQAGQGINVVQNDGYGATGGVFILAAGLILGWALAKRQPKETLKSIRKQSRDNYNELLGHAQSVARKRKK